MCSLIFLQSFSGLAKHGCHLFASSYQMRPYFITKRCAQSSTWWGAPNVILTWAPSDPGLVKCLLPNNYFLSIKEISTWYIQCYSTIPCSFNDSNTYPIPIQQFKKHPAWVLEAALLARCLGLVAELKLFTLKSTRWSQIRVTLRWPFSLIYVWNNCTFSCFHFPQYLFMFSLNAFLNEVWPTKEWDSPKSSPFERRDGICL